MKDYYRDTDGYFTGDSVDEFSWTEWQKKIDNEEFLNVLDELDFIDRLEFANSLIMNSENAYSYVSILANEYIRLSRLVHKLILEKAEIKNELNKFKNEKPV